MTTTKLKLNLGPQHPSTHGVLRLVLTLDGEKILTCEPDVGYLHRGMEKMAENMIYNELLSAYIQLDLEYPEIEFTQVIKENEQNLDNISSVILSIVQKA